jgi:nitroreductase
MNTFEVIAARRSAKRLIEPAPTDDQLMQMFVAAAQAPDHQELRPWQFIVIKGDKKDRLGVVMAEGLRARQPDATAGQVEKEQSKPDRAPLIIAVVARRMPSPLPYEEMYAATCAATQNLLLAATEMGFGSIWRSGDAVDDDMVRDYLGVAYGDKIVGFIYLGTSEVELAPHGPVDVTENVVWL